MKNKSIEKKRKEWVKKSIMKFSKSERDKGLKMFLTKIVKGAIK